MVAFPGPNSLTPVSLSATVVSTKPGFQPLRSVCSALSAIARGTMLPVDSQARNLRFLSKGRLYVILGVARASTSPWQNMGSRNV